MCTPSLLQQIYCSHQKSLIRYRHVWCCIMPPLFKKDEVCGFCPYTSVKVDNTSMAGGQMTIEQWTSMSMNISYKHLASKRYMFWGHTPECLGFTRTTLWPSPLQLHCSVLCLLVFDASLPTLLSSGAGTILALDLRPSSAAGLPIWWPRDPSQLWMETSASLWGCPHLTNLPLFFLLSSFCLHYIYIYFFSFLWLIWISNVLLISSVCNLLPMFLSMLADPWKEGEQTFMPLLLLLSPGQSFLREI